MIDLFFPYSAKLGSDTDGDGSTPSCFHQFKKSDATDIFENLSPAKVDTPMSENFTCYL